MNESPFQAPGGAKPLPHPDYFGIIVRPIGGLSKAFYGPYTHEDDAAEAAMEAREELGEWCQVDVIPLRTFAEMLKYRQPE